MSGQYYYSSGYYGSDGRMTYAVQRLILAHLVVFAAQLICHAAFGRPSIAGVEGDAIYDWLAFSGKGMMAGHVWTPVTYLFLHAGLLHLFFNMLWLYFFGPDVEHALGTRQFFLFYVICGAIGVLVTMLPVPLIGSNAPVLGASGAVMAVVMAFAVINPERELFLFPIPFPINARALVLIVIVLNIVNAMSGGGGVSVGTHLGGLAAGYGYMKLRPLLLQWEMRSGTKSKRRDPVGEAVDNIFKFEDKKRWKK